MNDNLIHIMSATLNAEAIAAFIECQDMISENTERERNGYALAYNEKAFFDLSDDLKIKIENAQNTYRNM